MNIRGGAGALVALAVATLMAAACSVANPFAPSNAAARSNAEQLALKFAQCMRQHGVNVSDPSGNGGVRIQSTGAPPGSSSPGSGAGSSAGTGTTSGGQNGSGPAADPTVQAAMDACKQYRPDGGRSSGPPSQQMVDAATKFAQCMRDHGIPMQDPQVSGNRVAIQSSPGAFDPSSDQFKQAQQACQHFMDQARPKS